MLFVYYFYPLCCCEADLLSMIFKHSATTSTLRGMLLGRLLVGTGMGLGPPVAALYVAEVSKLTMHFF